MAADIQNTQLIKLENLLLKLDNPRFERQKSQRDAMAIIAREQGAKLANLADDIVDRGLSPADLPVVWPSEQDNKLFDVQEGNRRIAALKLLQNPTLAETLDMPLSLIQRFKEISARGVDKIPTDILCAVVPPEDAHGWILLKHTGANEGVGVVDWDGVQSQRFRGTSPALQAIDLVAAGGYLDEATKAKLPKIAISNVERLLNTPEARKALGVDIRDNNLTLVGDDETALGRLATVVRDIAKRDIRVTDLDTKDQRVAYAEDVATRPPLKAISDTTAGSAGGEPVDAAGSSATGKTHRRKADRQSLVPGHVRLDIPQARLNRIYGELQRLKLDKFANSAAVLFRVFLELSLDDFGKRKKIKFKVEEKPKKPGDPVRIRDMYLREKIKAVAAYLEDKSFCEKGELHGIRTIANNRHHVLSVDTLNAYVHNKDYSPTPAELRTAWDNVESFMKILWSV